jgi:hypothetical protein
MLEQPANDVHNQLIKLFVDAAASIAARLDAEGLPTTVKQPRSFVTRDDAGGAATDHVYEPQSNLSDLELLMRASPLLHESVIESLRRAAEAVASKHATTLPYGFYPGGRTWPLIEPLIASRNQPPDFARDPADWTSRVLLQPALLHYLNRVPDVHSIDIRTAELFANDVERVANADDLSYVICVPLSAINLDPADGPVICGEYAFRRPRRRRRGRGPSRSPRRRAPGSRVTTPAAPACRFRPVRAADRDHPAPPRRQPVP